MFICENVQTSTFKLKFGNFQKSFSENPFRDRTCTLVLQRDTLFTFFKNFGTAIIGKFKFKSM